MKDNQKVDFGFGCMRLPVLRQDAPASFDYETIRQLFDVFLEAGFTYFDTAYTYHGYHGEEGVREALVKRHPRESFHLATKLPLRDFKDAADMERIFNEQLEHCGVEYFDYYLRECGDRKGMQDHREEYADSLHRLRLLYPRLPEEYRDPAVFRPVQQHLPHDGELFQPGGVLQ